MDYLKKKLLKEFKLMNQEETNPNEWLKQGELYFLQGDLKLAEDCFLNAIRLYPDLAEAHNNLGVIYWNTDQLEKSVAHFKRALSIDPQNRDAIDNLKQMSGMLENGFQAKEHQKTQTTTPPVQPEQKTATVSRLLASFSIPATSKGGLYLVDLERNKWEQVVDLNDLPMGMGKKTLNGSIGGAALHNDQIYMVAGDKLFIHDKDFKLIESRHSPYLENCRGIFASGNRLFLTSAGFESILVFDFSSRKFVEGYHVKYRDTANSINLLPFKPRVWERSATNRCNSS